MATRANTREFNWGKIVSEGMGGFLNPPTHPEHSHSVHSLYGDTFSMSLSAAVESDWLDDETKAAAKRMLDSWARPDIESPAIRDWVHRVLGYLQGCYQGDNGEWDASKLIIDQGRDPIANVDQHAGVHMIREYYPDYQPTVEDFKLAYWGTRQV